MEEFYLFYKDGVLHNIIFMIIGIRLRVKLVRFVKAEHYKLV